MIIKGVPIHSLNQSWMRGKRPGNYGPSQVKQTNPTATQLRIVMTLQLMSCLCSSTAF